MATHEQKQRKVFKHILGNPFATAWPVMTDEHTNSFVTLLKKEIEAQSLPEVALPTPSAEGPTKRRKVDEPNTAKTAKKTLILGVSQIVESAQKLEVVVALRSRENQVLVEPLWHFCRAKGVRIVAISYEIANEKMSLLTGVRRLAAFAVPKSHNLPISTAFLAPHARLLPAVSLLSCVVSRIESTPKTPSKTSPKTPPKC